MSELPTVGFVGLGAMGTPMVRNIMSAGYKVVVFDLDTPRVKQLEGEGAIGAASARDLVVQVSILVTMVPNDAVLRKVLCDETSGIIAKMLPDTLHISCSTTHPDTSREFATLHAKHSCLFIGAPIFARADGVAAKSAAFVVGGAPAAVERALPLLETTSNNVFRFGDDAGAGNVVKLCGNYMIAAAIESCAEALSLAEKSGLNRVDVMDMLKTTIFDCLIYNGYGTRVAHRSHVPGEEMVGPGFQLTLGLKDVTLALDVAHKVGAPMPFASVLHDRFLTAQARGRGALDWSAIALGVSEDGGVDISGTSSAKFLSGN